MKIVMLVRHLLAVAILPFTVTVLIPFELLGDAVSI
jgi:hypothetical protein